MNHRPQHGSSDAELVGRARHGDPDALGVLYARHAAAVMAVAFRLTRSAQDAEDVLHDVFLGLPEALRRYDERGTLAAWVKRLAAHAALNRMRAEGRRREVSLGAADDQPALPHQAGAARTVERAALGDALARLPDTLRVVFVLKEVEGYSHAEIGSMLGITSGASEVRLCRAVKALRLSLRSSR